MLIIAPIATTQDAPVVAVPVQASVVKSCASPFGECKSTFLEAHGFVLAITDLYLVVRGTGDQPEYPLTRSEVLSQEMCLTCRQKVVGKTFPTESTLKAMVGRVSANLRKIEAADKAKAWAEREARKSKKPVHHTRIGEDMLDVIAESAKRQAKFETRKRHHRLPAAERRRLAETRTSRSFAPTPSKNKKQKDSGKGKGRGK